MQGLDGLLMLHNPAIPDQEPQLERLYTTFAQPHSLTTAQCMTAAVEQGVAGKGLQGKLSRLQQCQLRLDASSWGKLHEVFTPAWRG
jgi:hypothetical protein